MAKATFRKRALPGTEPLVERATIPSSTGEISILIVLPNDQPANRGVLFLHGVSRRAEEGTPQKFLSEATELASAGYAAILPQGRFPWLIQPRDSGDVTHIDEECDRLQAVVDKLEALVAPAHPERLLGVVGHDFGGMYSLLLAARDARLACNVSVAATPRWADWFLRYWQIDGDRFDYLRALSPLDPIESAKDPRVPNLFQFGTRDFFIAEMTGREFEELAPGPTDVRFYPDGHEMSATEVRADRRQFLDRHLNPSGRSSPGPTRR